MALYLRRLFSRRQRQNISASAEPANDESIVPTGTPNSVLEHSGDIAVLSTHNGKRLCSWCRGISIESLTAPGGYMHAPSGKVLSSDCALCYLIEIEVAAWIHDSPVRLSVCWPNSNSSTSDAYLELYSSGVRNRTSTSLTVLPGDPASDLGIVAIATLTTTASSQSFESAKRWLRDCLSHRVCSESPYYLANDRPTRLLDLDAFGDYSTAVRLQDASHIQGNYAALSYCWGTIEEQRFITTSSTLNSRMSRIEYRDVPKTFQHAFQISKALGIQYLWIDALCILQDSPSDWRKESAKMGAIYSNSHVTIAADWSPDTNGGCYHPTAYSLSQDIENMIKITNFLSDGRESSIYFTKYYKSEMPDVEKSVLNTRAWAFQERLLSRRILHYTDKQIYWECRSQVCTEDLIPRDLGPIYPYPGIIISHLPSRSSGPDQSDVVLLWYDFIISKNYAARKLTHISDRLPAISALARVFSHFTSSSYLAGLWDYDLLSGLSWCRIWNRQSVGRLSNNCPSWSWASLDSDVWFGEGPRRNSKSFVRIQEAAVQLEGEDPFGRVRGGYIKLTGRLKKCILACDLFGRSDITSEDGTALGDAVMDTNEPVLQAYCLLLSSPTSVDSGVGLVLSLNSAERQEYRRLGFARLYGFGWPRPRNPVQSLFQDCTEQNIVLV